MFPAQKQSFPVSDVDGSDAYLLIKDICISGTSTGVPASLRSSFCTQKLALQERDGLYLFFIDTFIVAFVMTYMLTTHQDKYFLYNKGSTIIQISNAMVKSLSTRKWRSSALWSAVHPGCSTPPQPNNNPKGICRCSALGSFQERWELIHHLRTYFQRWADFSHLLHFVGSGCSSKCQVFGRHALFPRFL